MQREPCVLYLVFGYILHTCSTVEKLEIDIGTIVSFCHLKGIDSLYTILSPQIFPLYFFIVTPTCSPTFRNVSNS